MSFNFDLPLPIIVLLSVTLLTTLYICCIYAPFVTRVCKCRTRNRLTLDRPDGVAMPQASVIIYAQGEADRLETLLPSVLRQDYEGDFEVIVVNEGDSADVRNVIGALQLAYRNLYLTFTPDGARNLSRKKLALTLGIKAARYGVVVHTTADAIIDSERWLTKIMRNFCNQETGIVLGYAAPADKRSLGRFSTFAFADSSTSWVASAVGHRPFRGTELNLAYRRELFFKNKGFSRSLNLHFGDDDIFVSEIANRTNTVVELSPESIVRFSSYDMATTLRDSAVRRRFTSRFIARKPFPALQTGEAALWIGLLTAAASICCDSLNILTVAASSVLVVGTLTATSVSWRKATVALELRRLTFTAPLLALWHPLGRVWLSFYSSISKQKKYTWN